MAALLIALAILAILMSVAMPVWRHEARREKEAELVWRGEQYARAVALYRFKNSQIPNAYPPSIDALVEGRFLRKKYKDPMTKDGEFQIIPVGLQNNPGMPQNPQTPPKPIPSAPTQQTGTIMGALIGVRSKSQETSIRSYRGQTRYDQWAFTFNVAPRPGGAMPAGNTPDGRGNQGPGMNPGGRNPRGTGPGGRPGNPGLNPPNFGGPPPPPPPGGRRGVAPGGGRGPGL
jgi:type II secretory pathway pseudopilin PulG